MRAGCSDIILSHRLAAASRPIMSLPTETYVSSIPFRLRKGMLYMTVSNSIISSNNIFSFTSPWSLVISECPGIEELSAACRVQGNYNSEVFIYDKDLVREMYPDTDTSSFCMIEADKTYYINTVFAQKEFDSESRSFRDDLIYTCESAVSDASGQD